MLQESLPGVDQGLRRRLPVGWHGRVAAGVIKSGVPLQALAVYTALALHDGPAGCFPKQRTIAGILGCSERTVRKWITVLVEAELVEVIERRGRGGYRQVNAYVLHRMPWSQQAERSCLTEHALPPSEVDQRPAEQLFFDMDPIPARIASVVSLLEAHRAPLSGKERAQAAWLARSTAARPGVLLDSPGGVTMDARTEPSAVERTLIARGRRGLVFGEGIDHAEREALERWRELLTPAERAMLDQPIVAGDPKPLLEELRARWAAAEKAS